MRHRNHFAAFQQRIALTRGKIHISVQRTMFTRAYIWIPAAMILTFVLVIGFIASPIFSLTSVRVLEQILFRLTQSPPRSIRFLIKNVS